MWNVLAGVRKATPASAVTAAGGGGVSTRGRGWGSDRRHATRRSAIQIRRFTGASYDIDVRTSGSAPDLAREPRRRTRMIQRVWRGTAVAEARGKKRWNCHLIVAGCGLGGSAAHASGQGPTAGGRARGGGEGGG